ncbi:hypothetical protein KSF_111040 [Reticulibacter mediterranei]|uniref:Uncharacterized protein n=1 Tax=Reticulibacter mediterranei TaxID=2778369 RepID=A0A8J3J3T8_9CHLR|nr:hypothetical protein [Reticulibacter mediterranei]GHP01057.1 hypothetical protein KSF_111040 [Reticulibacter mediterranei]
MQSGTQPPARPGGSDIPESSPRTSSRRPLVQSAQIRNWLARPIAKIVLTVLVVMVVSAGGFFLVHSLQRHGLPDDIPLPDHSNFFRSDQASINDPTLGAFTKQKWGFTVSGTTLEQIDTFYRSQLPSNGWLHVEGGTSTVLSADKGGNPLVKGLFIGARPLPYNGDITLIIELHLPTS